MHLVEKKVVLSSTRKVHDSSCPFKNKHVLLYSCDVRLMPPRFTSCCLAKSLTSNTGSVSADCMDHADPESFETVKQAYFLTSKSVSSGNSGAIRAIGPSMSGEEASVSWAAISCCMGLLGGELLPNPRVTLVPVK